jgi:hypothetical protein
MVTATSLMLLSFTSSLGKVGNFSELTPALHRSGLVAMGTSALLIWVGRLSCGLLPAIRSKKARIAASISCVAPTLVVWFGLFYSYLPHHSFTISESVVVILWGFVVPGAASIGLNWGIETAAWRKAALVDS